jgi:hypothetical protein
VTSTFTGVASSCGAVGVARCVARTSTAPALDVLNATTAMPDLPVADIVRLTLTTRSLWPWR